VIILPVILLQVLAAVVVVYAWLEGKRESWYWFQVWSRRFKVYFPVKDEHPWFLAQRAIFYGPIVGCLYGLAEWMGVGQGWTVAEAIGLALVALVCHQGCYYQERERLKPGTYPMGFWDHNGASDRWSTKFFDPDIRFWMLVAGCIIHILTTVHHVLHIS